MGAERREKLFEVFIGELGPQGAIAEKQGGGVRAMADRVVGVDAQLVFCGLGCAKGVVRCLRQVHDDVEAQEKKHREDWVATIEKRFRNLCHATQRSRTKEPRWMQQCGLVATNGSAPDKDDDKTGADEGPRFTVSFNDELGLAYRQQIDADGTVAGPKTLSLSIDKSKLEALRDEDEIQAEWKDGFVSPVAGMTKHMYTACLAAQCGGKKAAIETPWEMEANGTKHALWIAQRLDRQLLVSLYEQGSQVLMVRADKFGFELPEPQPARVENTHPAVVAAAKMMIPIATDYAMGKITQGDKATLKQRRDAAMPRSAGVARKQPSTPATTCVVKRPAAAVASGTIDEPTVKRATTQADRSQDPQPNSDAASHASDPQGSSSAREPWTTVKAWLSAQDDVEPPVQDSLSLFKAIASRG